MQLLLTQIQILLQAGYFLLCIAKSIKNNCTYSTILFLSTGSLMVIALESSSSGTTSYIFMGGGQPSNVQYVQDDNVSA